MPNFIFNPVSELINLALGWFLMSYLQSLARAVLTGAKGVIVSRFNSIAFFHDKPAAILNIVIMATIWVVTHAIWFALHRK